ncbi:MAG: D-alanine--D-alanine ligase [Myxococcota bacterium]|nr:D-alanine--D-alanine ligase [Myxococcota bacterium]
MKKLRVMVLMHRSLLPPESLEGKSQKEIEEWRTEYDVVTTLKEAGHEVLELGVGDEILPIREGIKEWEPDIAFNLLEAFHGECVYDQHVVSYLELMRQHYTGCNPRGLTLARDKALSKKVLMYHRVKVPAFMVVPMGRRARRPRRLGFPLIVKSLVAEASCGIAQASVVEDDQKLEERVQFIHQRVGTDAIVEEYIDGREIYVGVMGTKRLEVFPAWEIILDNLPPDAVRIATEKVKWDPSYQKRHQITWKKAALAVESEERLAKLSKRIYRALNLSGYARLDFRMDAQGQLFLLEANPNPNIAWEDEFAMSAKEVGVEYPRLLERILRLGLRRDV